MFLEKLMSGFARKIEDLSRLHRPLIWAVQIAAFVCSLLAAFLLRFDFRIPAAEYAHVFYALSILVAVKSAAFRAFGLDRRWWRLVSIADVVRIGWANAAGTAAGALLIWWAAPSGFPRSVFVMDFVLSFLTTSGARVAVRVVAEAGAAARKGGPVRQVLIYGAGTAGTLLLDEIRRNPSLPYRVTGFIDDNAEKAGLRVHGLRVLGAGADLPALVAAHKAEMVLIAIPSASGPQMTGILERCHFARVEFKTIPGLSEVIEGGSLMAQVRDVAVEDLLGRKPVHLEEAGIRAKLEGQVVLVTGAAGSIGSEICRQAARFHPRAIVALDISESPLFDLDLEMRRRFPGVHFHPAIGSVQNRARLAEVFAQYAPSLVYHAAAYKHVPMMEAHTFEAIENNVFGTYNAAVVAAEYGVREFVLISSDKAVRPANVMGATKHLAELLIQSLQASLQQDSTLEFGPMPDIPGQYGPSRRGSPRGGQTKYIAVRFGNVLGSNGSVIPIFKRQIAAGGPVTVTHPAMRRYFMTIPEACQLVLQASAIGEAGQILVLDMGDPVKIADLARNLILLSGLRPGQDIQIQFTGTRPGEKLYEELNSLLEDTVPTAHEKIRVHAARTAAAGDAEGWLEALRDICRRRDLGRLIMALKEAVPEYNPSASLLRRVVEERSGQAGAHRSVLPHSTPSPVTTVSV